MIIPRNVIPAAMTTRVLLLGATGKTGRAIIERMRDEPDIELTAYARSPWKIQDIEGIYVVEGDATDGSTLPSAM